MPPGTESAAFHPFAQPANRGAGHIWPSMRRPLAVLLFFIAVVGFTFASTVVHELGHALAWDATEGPVFIVAGSRDDARDVVAAEKSMNIDGQNYRVLEVERTTIALYPKTILITGATLGIAPSALLSDQVLASTFYALDDEDYATLAAGGDPTGWQEAATPMIVNGFLAIPIWIWLLWRPHAVSMAAAWANAAEWRYNVHHATEVGIPTTLYLGASLLVMAITVGVITFLAVGGWRRPGPASPRVPVPSGGVPGIAVPGSFSPSPGQTQHVVRPNVPAAVPPVRRDPTRTARPAPASDQGRPAASIAGRRRVKAVTSPGRTQSRTERPPNPGSRSRGSGP